MRYPYSASTSARRTFSPNWTEQACDDLSLVIDQNVCAAAPFSLLIDDRLDTLYAVVVNSALDDLLDPIMDGNYLLSALKVAYQKQQQKKQDPLWN